MTIREPEEDDDGSAPLDHGDTGIEPIRSRRRRTRYIKTFLT